MNSISTIRSIWPSVRRSWMRAYSDCPEWEIDRYAWTVVANVLLNLDETITKG